MIVDRITNPTRDQFEQYINNNKPFIITNVVEHWSCYTKWVPKLNHNNSNNNDKNQENDDYLNMMIKNKQIPVRENVDYNSGEWLGKTKEIDFQIFYKLWKEHYIDFKQYQQNQKDSGNSDKVIPKYYLASLPVKTYFKQLEDDYVTPEIPKEQNKSANLWIGFKDQVTPLHHDFSSGDPGMDGLHAVIVGKKLFKLFDPELNVGCFKRKKEWGQFHHSEFDIDNPDYTVYPEAKNAICIDIELNQGEILYIPKLWWHYVKTLEPSISLNFWFQHMGSELLKLTKLWGHMNDYLDAVYNMSTCQLSNDKMISILRYLSDGKLVLDENDGSSLTIIQQFKDDPFKLMQFPKFINSFSNAVNNPLFKNHPSRDYFKVEITQLVNNWIKNKQIERQQIQ